MTEDDLIDDAASRRSEGWLSLLADTVHTKQRVADGGYVLPSAPRILRANSSRLTAVTGDRWLAVGDAAVAYDPLSSYGIGSAVVAGYYAACAIADFFQGSPDALSTYATIINRAYADYLLLQHQQYLSERRWPESPFWRRRRAPTLSTETA